MFPYCSFPLSLPSASPLSSSICLNTPLPLTPPSLFHLPHKPYWFLRLWQVMAECCLPWDNCLIIGAVMSAPLPPAYLFINVMCHLLHAQEGQPGRLNNCRAVPHRLVGLRGGELRGQNEAFRIHMWNQWNGRPIYRGIGAGSKPSCSLGYSSNKSMEWFYYCIDWKNCAVSTKPSITLFCVSSNVFCRPVVLLTI